MSPLARQTVSRFSKQIFHFSRTLSRQRNFASVSMPFVEDQLQVLPKRSSIQAVLMRSGTSKGLYFHRDDLPESVDEWSPILLSAMGSANGDKRQLDGVGGGSSTTSKVAVISRSKRADADIDYTFVQVAVGADKIDMSGNCGNVASGVAPFALDEGLVSALPGQKEVRHLSIHIQIRRKGCRLHREGSPFILSQSVCSQSGTFVCPEIEIGPHPLTIAVLFGKYTNSRCADRCQNIQHEYRTYPHLYH